MNTAWQEKGSAQDLRAALSEHIREEISQDESWNDWVENDQDVDLLVSDLIDNDEKYLSDTPLITPLIWACRYKESDWIKALVDAGADTQFKSGSETPFSILRDRVYSKLMMEMQIDAESLRQEPRVQDRFIQDLTQKMNETGLWDITAAVPSDVGNVRYSDKRRMLKSRLLAATITLDLNPQEPPNQARAQAIGERVMRINRSKFLEAVSYMIKPEGQFEPRDPALKKALAYGLERDFLLGTEHGMHQALEEVLDLSRSRNRFVEPVITQRRARM